MLGHLMEWFYSGLAGIRNAADGIGFNKIDIVPEFVTGVQHVKASFESPYGTIKSEWKAEIDTFELKVEIPANTTATVTIPFPGFTVTINGKVVATSKPSVKDKTKFAIGSGSYTIIVNTKMN